MPETSDTLTLLGMPREILLKVVCQLAQDEPMVLLEVERTSSVLRRLLIGNGAVWRLAEAALLSARKTFSPGRRSFVTMINEALADLEQAEVDGIDIAAVTGLASGPTEQLRAAAALRRRFHLEARLACFRCGSPRSTPFVSFGARLCKVCLDVVAVSDHHARLRFPALMAKAQLVASLPSEALPTNDIHSVEHVWRVPNPRMPVERFYMLRHVKRLAAALGIEDAIMGSEPSIQSDPAPLGSAEDAAQVRRLADLDEITSLMASMALESKATDQGSASSSAGPVALPVQHDQHLSELLVNAVHNGDADSVRELLASGADPNSRDEAWWPVLYVACFNGSTAVVKELLRSPLVDVDQRGPFDSSPLFIASYFGFRSVVAALLQHPRANPNAKTCIDLDYGRDNPWLAAARKGRIQTLLLLSKHPAMTIEGYSPLHAVASAASTEVARVLLALGASINQPDAKGITPLIAACFARNVALVDLLLELPDIHVEALSGTSWSMGWTALLAACCSGSVPIVRRLLQCDRVRVDSRDKRGRSAMQIALEEQHVDVIWLLLDDGRFEITHTSIKIAARLGNECLLMHMIRHPRCVPKLETLRGAVPQRLLDIVRSEQTGSSGSYEQ
nr:Ankyrin repeat domain-containing protein 16 [Polyrhizophydium stewartii]